MDTLFFSPSFLHTENIGARCCELLNQFLQSPDETDGNATRLSIMLRIVVTEFMSLTTLDLMKWADDPEEYVLSQESCSTDSNLRATAQDFYLTLAEYDEGAVSREYVSMMKTAQGELDAARSGGGGGVSEDALVHLCKRIDGMWTGAGLDTSLLKSCFSYEQWFMQTLVPVITSTVQTAQQQQQQQQQVTTVTTSPHQRILQYRSLWLIGCLTWELPIELHGSIYNSLLQLLAVNDVVVCVVREMKSL